MAQGVLRKTSGGFAGLGGGRQRRAPMVPFWRGSSVQVCGLYPFSVGMPVPMVGVPFGHAQTDDGRVQTVCFDPISWFERGLISSPSMFVMGLIGLGKSSAIRHLIAGYESFGVHTMVLGDLKPDYVDLVEALGGQVITIGRGHGVINPLDTGLAGDMYKRLPPREAEAARAASRGRRKNMISTLVQLSRSENAGRLTTPESNLLTEALTLLDEKHEDTPIVADLISVIRQGPQRLRDAVLDRGEPGFYEETTASLVSVLMSIDGDGFGGIFSGHTSTPMRLDRYVVFDISSIAVEDEELTAAALLAAWNYGFANVNAHNRLADAGLVERERFFVVMD
ncbi:MAG: ATP/GTP-binding protein, partial [Actinomycetaceae bacterium]|nr:ATP/GTP-binding protein [Actinomycetaceae bacterium]